MYAKSMKEIRKQKKKRRKRKKNMKLYPGNTSSPWPEKAHGPPELTETLPLFSPPHPLTAGPHLSGWTASSSSARNGTEPTTV
jgi:hypothetical protein